MRVFRRLALVAGAILGLAAGTVSAQAPTTSTSTQTRQFEIVSVDGNKVVVKGNEGYREITVADDFRLSVDGRAVGVRELKPGMKGTATITTTTTSTPVTVTQVKDGVVMQKTGNSIIVRTADGIKMFSEGDAAKRGVRILRDGAPLAFTDLNTGDHLTAVIVTTHPPKVMTQRQVAASMGSAAAPMETPRAEKPTRMAAATPVGPPTAPTASAPAPEEPRHLPKTASPLPLIALVGAGSTMLGLALGMLRRRRSA
jgi:LPXTG-motif cell wall-anchored protein